MGLEALRQKQIESLLPKMDSKTMDSHTAKVMFELMKKMNPEVNSLRERTEQKQRSKRKALEEGMKNKFAQDEEEDIEIVKVVNKGPKEGQVAPPSSYEVLLQRIGAQGIDKLLKERQKLQSTSPSTQQGTQQHQLYICSLSLFCIILTVRYC